MPPFATVNMVLAISPSESKLKLAAARALVLNKTPSVSFADGCVNTIEGKVLYLLSALPNIFTVEILPAFVLPAGEANKFDQPPPVLLIVILPLSNSPSDVIPMVTLGFTPLPLDDSIPLNDIAGGLE